MVLDCSGHTMAMGFFGGVGNRGFKLSFYIIIPGRILITPWTWLKYELPPCKFIWSNGGGSYAPLLKRGHKKCSFLKCPSNHASFADSIYLKVSSTMHNDLKLGKKVEFEKCVHQVVARLPQTYEHFLKFYIDLSLSGKQCDVPKLQFFSVF